MKPQIIEKTIVIETTENTLTLGVAVSAFIAAAAIIWAFAACDMESEFQKTQRAKAFVGHYRTNTTTSTLIEPYKP